MEKSWVQKNKNKSIKSLIKKDGIVTIVELVLLKIQKGDIPLGKFREGARGLGFKIRLSELFDKGDVIDMLSLDDELQEDIVKVVLSSRIYQEFISEILVAASRKIFFKDNLFTEKVPVFGRLAKMGQVVAHKTLNEYTDMASTFEHELKHFVKKNLHILDPIVASLVASLLAPDIVAKIVDFVWEHLHDKQICVDDSVLEKISIDLTVAIPHLVDGFLDTILDKVGDMTLKEVL
jgi:hypothetical protein